MEKVYFGQCMKNHSVALGRTILDGCGEFLAPLNSPDSLVCSVCGCHRNYHKKTACARLSERPEPLAVVQQVGCPVQSVVPPALVQPQLEAPEVVLALPAANTPVKKRDVEQLLSKVQAGGGESSRRFLKKPKTIFEDAQKEKMFAFAEYLGWKMDRERSAEIDDFCHEIMVPRNVFRVWLHNHKPDFPIKMTSMDPAAGGASVAESCDNGSSTKSD